MKMVKIYENLGLKIESMGNMAFITLYAGKESVFLQGDDAVIFSENYNSAQTFKNCNQLIDQLIAEYFYN